ncbi:Precorrin-2 C(20)-methyltransferase [Rhodovastum atsumiense]|uniref:Precorrin-2 C(20)-methyltransferase n=1 Tax=Rhodovastum atsumiense TaxID=504468 RepID=A0A5M6IWY0_9PROT|nr:precorrin-2 C(20)-methyltransferase [Rhodovastum atsumiense]KAA5612836.1 precorrin-2 C(20)-methyltransferase [Rhodovastum atsumiense]CAH2601099.1 Precorrin-2 C(20)-methyltransferase [Rhodovastum atsumiense]
MSEVLPPSPGRLFGLGVGPGDPELITLKALRLLQAAPVVAYPAARGKNGNALTTVAGYLREEQIRLRLVYPVTVEKLPAPFCYETALRGFYDEAAAEVAAHLDAGRDVAVICEGDPFFYGSFMYLHDRLAGRYQTEVVPGVCSVLASSAVLGAPLVYRNQTLTVLSGVLAEEELRRRLAGCEAAAIMKLGGNFTKVRAVVQSLGLLDRARYVERATMAGQRVARLDEVDAETVPYFAMVLLPGECWGSVAR